MDPGNLAICFGPTLMPTPDLLDQVSCQAHVNEIVKTIIIHHETIFPDTKELEGPVYEKCMSNTEYWWGSVTPMFKFALFKEVWSMINNCLVSFVVKVKVRTVNLERLRKGSRMEGRKHRQVRRVISISAYNRLLLSSLNYYLSCCFYFFWDQFLLTPFAL